MLKAMNIRLHNEHVVKASFHGIKIPLMFNPTEEKASEPEISIDPALEERILKQAQERVKARIHGRR